MGQTTQLPSGICSWMSQPTPLAAGQIMYNVGPSLWRPGATRAFNGVADGKGSMAIQMEIGHVENPSCMGQ